MEVKKHIEKLREMILYHNTRYFIDQDPEISDQEYDQLFAELKVLEEQYPQYDDPKSPTHIVGGFAENTFVEVKHKIPMLSLDKSMSWNAFVKWFLDMTNKGVHDFAFEMKLDGLATSLLYEEGKLIRGATRGDGEIGEDITATVMTIPNVPKKIKCTDTVEVRGEVILLHSGLDNIRKAMNKNYKNVRNAASGILRTKNPSAEVGKQLRFKAYGLNSDELEFNTHWGAMDFLEKQGFEVAIGTYGMTTTSHPATIDDILPRIKDHFEMIQKQREKLDYDIDGIVIKANKWEDQAKLGSKTNVPNWATAFKFEAQEKVTQLLDVEWLLGNKGNMTPRALLKPIEILGTTITKPTLHNYEEIKRLGLKIGDYVVVSRRGDVIPKVERVITELRTGDEKDIVPPTHCPECGQVLTNDGVFFRCENPDCGGNQQAKIENFIRALEIEEFGPKVIAKLIEAGKLNDLADIYHLVIDDIANLERMGKRSAQKIIDNINKSRMAPLGRVIAGLTIKKVGMENGKDLAEKYSTLENFAKAKVDELQTMNGIGGIVSQHIVDWLNDPVHQNLISRLVSIGIGQIKPREVSGTSGNGQLGGKKFSFTGTLSIPRKKVEDMITDNGGEVFGIKKGLDYLILGEGGKGPKVEKAKQFGAQIINEQQFYDMLK